MMMDSEEEIRKEVGKKQKMMHPWAAREVHTTPREPRRTDTDLWPQ